MKRILTIIALFISVISYGQIDNSNPTKNRTEVKFNVFSLSLGAIDFEFERTLNSHSSLGMSFKQAFDTGQNSEVAAFYRYYFGKKYASGFFIEGFGMYHSKYEYLFSTGSSPSTLNDVYRFGNDFALGLGIGYKLVSKKGLILQAHLGAGRNLFNGKNSYGELFPGKAGISIGYRF